MTNVVPFDRLGEGNGARPRRARAVMAGLLSVAATSTTLPITAAPAEAIVPGPNGRIVFESGGDIFTMNPDGSVPLNLTNSPGVSDVFPAWSPDSTQITFSSDRAEARNADVYLMNADGTGVTRLTNAPGEDRGTSWTSDGERIVFHSSRDRDETHAFDIFTMNPDGSDQTKIFTNGSAAYVCGDSETGTIVFNSSGDPLGTNPTGDFEIFTMDIDGNNVFQVTDNTLLDSGPKWSPDCSTISYNSRDSGGFDVYRIDADGSDRVNLTNTPGVFDAFSAWSPDGTRVVFSSNRDGNFEIYTMDSGDGSDVARLTFTEDRADFRPDWGTGQILIDGPPQTKADCKNQGYKAYFRPESFKNQGQCVSYVQSNRRAKR
ncbi:MAG: hypothetical protein KY451_02615 [Actinobacteria bacterium]|nr:hypothetical protein [Actinomycetota bacterium]